MAEATIIHTVGTKVWIRDEKEAWIKGEVVKVLDDAVLVKAEDSGAEVKCKPEDAPLQNPHNNRGVDDMTRLSYLHEPAVLWNLNTRYAYDDIYTYTGTILIAINPFASLPHLYGTHMMDQYRGVDIGDIAPHVYAIADAAYRQMRKEMKGQSILVSGESGAGKTETSKLIMKYLAYMGGYSIAGEAQGSGRSVEEQVLESNPLLEAFGNAKTTRNNNSSRFGKYVEINFNDRGVISGAAIRTYLLERSRVVAINNPERNYHIFYQLCDGASPEQRTEWRLRPATDFRYLNQSTCYQLPGVDNAEEFKRTIYAMERVGIPSADQQAIFRTVAAILQLGNISFSNAADDSAVVAPAGEEYLDSTAYLLGVDKEGLRDALTTRVRQTPDGKIVSPLDARAAAETRDSLAKIIYAKMFDWLVTCINAAIGEDKNCAASVGVLDIYGFEQFQYNDFEQFCINLANEKLQQHFNQHVFKMEQADYEREQIDWSYIEFVDNQDVLDLIEGKMGILDLLDETCRFVDAKGKDFAEKLFNSPTCKDTRRFSKPKVAQTQFIIDHYAGPVKYDTANFLDKNKDFVVPEHQALLYASSMPFVSTLFAENDADAAAAAAAPGRRPGPANKGVKFNSVGSQFKKQLAELMVQLHAMEPHYIRCIKPNESAQPSVFENKNVLHQLKCGGVMEAVRISCAGFPSKRPYGEFVDHFWPLAPDLLKTDSDDRDITRAILAKAGVSGYQLGTTKVFLRAGQMAQLDKMRTDTLNGAAVTIQRFARGFVARRRYVAARAAVLTIQSAARAWAARKLASQLRRQKAALAIQCYWRMYKARTEYLETRRLIMSMQSMFRGRNARQRLTQLRRMRAAVTIQRCWRGFVARRAYQATLRAALTLQSGYRIKVAKKKLRALRQEAREGTKLLEDKKALEQKVHELQAMLETVQNQRNELRQQAKAELAARTALEARVAEMSAELEVASKARLEEQAEELAKQQARVEELETESASLKERLAAAEEATSRKTTELATQLKRAQDYIGQLMAERKQIDNKFHDMKTDLITRLQNACTQRDEARGRVLELENEMAKLQENLSAKDRQLAAAAATAAAVQAVQAAAPLPAAASPAPAGTPMASSNAAANTMQNMLQKLQASAPGYGRHMADTITGLFGKDGAPAPLRTPPRAGMEEEMRAVPGQLAPAPGAESEADRRMREAQLKQVAMLAEKRKAEEDRLLAALTAAPPLPVRNGQQPTEGQQLGPAGMGFHKGRPVAAIVIFRYCLHSRAFQADRTAIFDRIVGVIGTQVERGQDDNNCLAYWLSNTVTLLHMLNKNIKPASGNAGNRTRAAGTTAGVGAATRSVLGAMFGSRSGASPSGMGLAHSEASIHGGGVGGFKQVEAKYPALLFKQQLDAFVQKIFPMIRDNVRKEISPMLSNCIHTPKTSTRTAARPGSTSAGDKAAATSSSTAAAASLHRSWSDILGVFEVLLDTVKANNVPKVLVQALFKQLFRFVNVQLFNQLLLRRECCSFSNGEYVKTGLEQVANWINGAGADYIADSWEELKYLRQAVTFLVIGNKPKKSLEEITSDLCPVLSIQQLYRISTMYWDDKYNTETVSPEVLGKMKTAMVESSSSASHSFLLDDDSSLPFQAAELLANMDDKDLYSGMPVPEVLAEGDGAASFAFLEKELRFAAPVPA